MWLPTRPDTSWLLRSLQTRPSQMPSSLAWLPPTHFPARYRDPSLPIHRTEITRFPHAILEIKLALPEGEQPPEWVRDLMDSGLITEVGGRAGHRCR